MAIIPIIQKIFIVYKLVILGQIGFFASKNFDFYLIIKLISRSTNMSKIYILNLKQLIEKTIILLPIIYCLFFEVYKDIFTH